MDQVINISVTLVISMLGFMFLSLLLDVLNFHQGSWPRVRQVVKFLLLAGTVFAILYETILFRQPYEGIHFLLTPFLELREALNGNNFYVSQIILNILLYVPFGFMLRSSIWKSNWQMCLLTSLLLCLCVELYQGFMQIGVFEVDDMINNTLGGMLGYGAHYLLRHLVFRR